MSQKLDPIESCPRCKRGVQGEPEGDPDCVYWKFSCPTPDCNAVKWTRLAINSEYMELLGRIDKRIEAKK